MRSSPRLIRIEQLRLTYKDDGEALAVLDQLAREPETHRKHSDCYAYEFFVTKRQDGALDKASARK